MHEVLHISYISYIIRRARSTVIFTHMQVITENTRHEPPLDTDVTPLATTLSATTRAIAVASQISTMHAL